GVAYFAPAFFGQSQFYRDTGKYFLPHKALIAEALRQGRLPLWDPWSHTGMPLLADPNFNTFHPLSLLGDLLPLPLGLMLFAMAHAIAAAYGGYALARALGCSRTAAGVGGFAFAWSGAAVSLL